MFTKDMVAKDYDTDRLVGHNTPVCLYLMQGRSLGRIYLDRMEESVCVRFYHCTFGVAAALQSCVSTPLGCLVPSIRWKHDDAISFKSWWRRVMPILCEQDGDHVKSN